MNYKLSTKVNGKWWTFGNIKINQWGNLQASFKNTEQLKKLILEGGEWINFSLFEDNGGSAHNADNAHNQAKQDGYQPQKTESFDIDSEIPF